MKLDYLSFTVLAGEGAFEHRGGLIEVASAGVRELGGPLLVSLLKVGGHFERGPGRAPYGYGCRRIDNGCFIYGSPARSEILIEMTGRGCDYINTHQNMLEVMDAVKERVTRLDFALDIETQIGPQSFVAAGYSSRFSTRTSMDTKTGQTEYVGSMKSDLQARVYRYAAPHPRSRLLRVEHVFRRDRAKAAALRFLDLDNEIEFAASVVETFQWSHPLVENMRNWSEPLSAAVTDRKKAGRAWWIYEQVAPAFAQALEDGEIDWVDFGDRVIECQNRLKLQHRRSHSNLE